MSSDLDRHFPLESRDVQGGKLLKGMVVVTPVAESTASTVPENAK